MASPQPKERPEALAPHATLSEYYRSDRDRPGFVRGLFDRAAADYDTIERGMGLGSGRRYRREALARAGLAKGMRVLDVAIGTGLVAREAIRLVGDARLVTGLDPSAGMVAQARRNLAVGGVLGMGEQLPWRDASFDFVSMGYALRHLADLTVTFREFARVLRPGGTLCILELTKPRSRAGHALIRLYLHGVVPLLTRLRTRNPEATLLMRYFWDTIENCVPPERILAALDEAGFLASERTLVIGLFSEYTARKPDPDGGPVPPPGAAGEDSFFVRRIAR